MLRVLSFLQKNLVWSIPISMGIGLVYGYLLDAGPLKNIIIPVTFIMVYPMMATLNIKTIFKGRDYKLQVTTQIINFVLVPLLAFFTGRLFFRRGTREVWPVGRGFISHRRTAHLRHDHFLDRFRQRQQGSRHQNGRLRAGARRTGSTDLYQGLHGHHHRCGRAAHVQADRPVCFCTADRGPVDPDPGHQKIWAPDLERSHQTEISPLFSAGVSS